MELNNLIGKREKVKVIGITNNKKYYVAESISNQYKIYIENTGDYEIEELMNSIEECLIIDIKQNNLIGFILSNRKFQNDIKKIEQKLKNTGEYKKVKDIYLMERLKIKGKVLGLYLVDEGDIGVYYLETIEIGKWIKKERENNILFKDKKIEDEIGNQIKDVVQSIDLTKKEISLNQEKEKTKAFNRKGNRLRNRRKYNKNSNTRFETKTRNRPKRAKEKHRKC